MTFSKPVLQNDVSEAFAKNAAVDPAFWSSRCWFWQDESARNETRRSLRERKRRPLVLTGHGVSLRIDGGTLAIRNGRTHYPQKVETCRYFRGDLDLPERIILLDGTGSLTLNVISWLAEQGVTLIQLNWQGEVTCVSAPLGYSANRYRVEWQRSTRDDDESRMRFCNGLITRKIEASIIALERSVRRSAAWETAMQIAYATLTRLDQKPPQDVVELRGIEGAAAAAYFRAWASMPVRWRKRSRRPIPEEWLTVGVRSSGYYATGNRHAHHPVYAILNYAYTVLQSQVQIWAICEGYDPTIGIMHETRPGGSAFVFDIMEPRRAETDRKVLEFIKNIEFDPADFIIRADGVCRLNPEMARRVVRLLA